jgi:DegV family protein with EDD domain
MTRIAVVTDSASDMTPAEAAANNVTVIPLLVTFGDKEYRAGVDMSAEMFWTELTKPGAAFPRTAAAAPGTFRDAFAGLFAQGVDEIVYIGPGSKLSATVQSARVASEMLPDKKIHVIDSESASMGEGLLALSAARMAAAGASAEEIVADVERRKPNTRLYLVLETLEYLKRGGRISGAQAAIGSLLSIKPIITLEDGVVATADRPRTRGKARARVLELLAETKPECIAVLHGQAPDIEAFADELAAELKFPREQMTFNLVGASVGPHVGPGAYGAVVLPKVDS